MIAATKREISRADLLPMADYGRERKALRVDMVAVKKHRRVEVGPVATFYFENYQTMWHQVHEMLFIEKGGEGQIADELAAYNPLIPQGDELVATVMLEIEDPVRRARVLSGLGHIEDHMYLEIAGAKIYAISETDVERTKEDGKTSSVHFVRFKLTPAQIAEFRKEGTRVLLGVDHVNYGHIAVVAEATRAALSVDFA
jgi:hypothetical protein